MVQTRRQSGKLPPPRYPAAAATSESGEEDGDDEDGVSSELTELENNVEAKDVLPARKRAKTNGTPTSTSTSVTTAATAVRKKRVGGLSMLPHAPLDILFEIFGHLTLKDLLSLSRTNKLLRKTLLSRSSLGVWKNTRLVAEVPDGPEEMSEPAWAELLFGTTCQNCGEKCVTTVDFAIRRRCCSDCRKEHIVCAGLFERKFPNLNPVIMKLIPFASIGGWAQGYSPSSRFFWDADVYTMSRQLIPYRNTVHMITPGAEAPLDTFKEDRKAEVIRVIEQAGKYEVWAEAWASEAGKKRISDIVARLLALGWHQRDVDRIQFDLQREPNNNKELTDRGFAMMKSRLETTLATYKSKRIERETIALRGARTTMVPSTYYDFKGSLPPKSWALLPRLLDFQSVEAVRVWLEVEDGVEDGKDVLEREEVERLCGGWKEERRAGIEALIQEDCESLRTASTDSEPSQIITDRVIPVFVCSSRGCTNDSESPNPPSETRSSTLVGIESAVVHSCRGRVDDRDVEPGELKFCRRGGEGFASVLKVVGLDIKAGEHVVEEMDRVDARFVCERCAPVEQYGVLGKFIMTWRQCVDHYIEYDDVCHGTPSWQLLDMKQRTRVVDQQRDPARKAHRWLCGLCQFSLKQDTTHRAIRRHYRQLHALENVPGPIKGKDIFYNPSL
ncbi:hypothetical protein JAAARDRAFT_212227, partial [Jaapia argillacea MUCL 33604]